eukprot:scaffold58778_cov33-Tisochrysis_lutea.AAC.4
MIRFGCAKLSSFNNLQSLCHKNKTCGMWHVACGEWRGSHTDTFDEVVVRMYVYDVCTRLPPIFAGNQETGRYFSKWGLLLIVVVARSEVRVRGSPPIADSDSDSGGHGSVSFERGHRHPTQNY